MRATPAFVLAILAPRAVAGGWPVITPSDTTAGYLSMYGIQVEEHFATTDDQYILGMFRLRAKTANSPVVLLQHGILASSWCWIVNSPDRALGISLWNRGYDVWLTNSRGNTYSRNHTKFIPDKDKAFWNYTFDDMGHYDVVANVRHILGVTSRPTLTFVAWSQGVTQMLVAATGEQRTYLESHVNFFAALSPVSYMIHQESALLRIVKDFRLGAILETLYPYGFLDQQELPSIVGLICKLTFGKMCQIGVDAVCGISDIDRTFAIENLVAHFPAGTSVKDLNHFEQLIAHQRFGRYDYGKRDNMKHYLQPAPPNYTLSALRLPTALFMGSKDDLADPGDVAILMDSLSNNSFVVFAKTYEGYSHVSWMVGNSTEWLDDLIPMIQRHNPFPNQTLAVLV